MPDDSVSSARDRFSRDLRRIREDRDVSLATLHEATQVPESHLQAFEEGTLYEESRMNAVYLKAFVRAYAEAVGLPPNSVVDQLEAALAGEYQDQLVAQYLDVPPSDADASSTEGDPHAKPGGETTEGDEEGPENVSSTEEAGEPSPAEATPEPGSRDASVRSAEERGRGTREEPKSSPPVQTQHSTSEGSSPASPAGVDPTGRTGWAAHWRTFSLATALLGLLAFSVWGITNYFGASNTASGPSTPPEKTEETPATPTEKTAETPAPSADPLPADVDTAGVTGASSAESSPPPSVPAVRLLRDTMHVTVLANSPVREMRVQQDDDLRRPYWIEAGEALVFPFTRRITLQNQLDSLRLFLEDYPYPSTHRDAEGRVVITRDSVRTFADTLRGEPSSLSVTPDTVEIRLAPPAASDTTDEAS